MTRQDISNIVCWPTVFHDIGIIGRYYINRKISIDTSKTSLCHPHCWPWRSHRSHRHLPVWVSPPLSDENMRNLRLWIWNAKHQKWKTAGRGKQKPIYIYITICFCKILVFSWCFLHLCSLLHDDSKIMQNHAKSIAYPFCISEWNFFFHSFFQVTFCLAISSNATAMPCVGNGLLKEWLHRCMTRTGVNIWVHCCPRFDVWVEQGVYHWAGGIQNSNSHVEAWTLCSLLSILNSAMGITCCNCHTATCRWSTNYPSTINPKLNTLMLSVMQA